MHAVGMAAVKRANRRTKGKQAGVDEEVEIPEPNVAGRTVKLRGIECSSSKHEKWHCHLIQQGHFRL